MAQPGTSKKRLREDDFPTLNQAQTQNAIISDGSSLQDSQLDSFLPDRKTSLSRKRYPHDPARRYCNACHRILVKSLTSATDPRLQPVSSFTTYDSRVDVQESLTEERLRSSSISCELCAILLSILQGPDGLLLTQTKLYQDPQFNPFGNSYGSSYDENGVSDDECYGTSSIMKKPKVEITLRAGIDGSPVPRHPTHLLIQLTISFRTQKRSSFRTRVRALKGTVDYSRVSLFKSMTIFNTRDSPLPEALLDSFSILEPMLFNSKPILGILDLPPPMALNDSLLSPDPRLGPPEKVLLIHSWLQQEPEASITTTSIFPKRLLRLSSDEVAVVNYEIIASCSSAGQVIPYVALSHRWGSLQHVTTSKSNLDQFKSGVDIAKLPKTFQDALNLARILGFSYVWIDALCIIQDSAEDWATESQKMGAIFMNARVTFAIHCAEDDSTGFLAASLDKRPAIQIPIGRSLIGICAPIDPERDVTHSTLSRRGWVLQERVLSSRTVHFTVGHVYLESKDGMTCEDGSVVQFQAWNVEQQQTPRYNPSALSDLRSLLRSASTSNPTTSTQPTPLEWLDLVEIYSHCNLTRASDKLIAISGLVHKIQAGTTQAWHAGIWADRLCEGLLWFPTDQKPVGPFEDRAPSWSWALWDRPIQHPSAIRLPAFEPRCRLIALPKDLTPISCSGPCHLVVCGRLINLSALTIDEKVRVGPGPPRRGDLNDRSRGNLPQISLKQYVDVNPVRKGWGSHMIGWIAFDDQRDIDLHTPCTYHSPREAQVSLEWKIANTTLPSIREFDEMFSSSRRESTPPPLYEICHTGESRTSMYFLILGTLLNDGEKPMCLGLFLTSSKRNIGSLRRVGVGQMSWAALSELIEDEVTGVDPRSSFQDRERTPDPLTMDEMFSEVALTYVTLE